MTPCHSFNYTNFHKFLNFQLPLLTVQGTVSTVDFPPFKEKLALYLNHAGGMSWPEQAEPWSHKVTFFITMSSHEGLFSVVLSVLDPWPCWQGWWWWGMAGWYHTHSREFLLKARGNFSEQHRVKKEETLHRDLHPHRISPSSVSRLWFLWVCVLFADLDWNPCSVKRRKNL